MRWGWGVGGGSSEGPVPAGGGACGLTALGNDLDRPQSCPTQQGNWSPLALGLF